MEVKKYNQMMSYLTRPKKRPDLGEYGEADGRVAQGDKIKGKLKKPLTSEQKEILEDVYKVKTFKAAKKKFGNTKAFEIVNRIRAGQVYKGMKSPLMQGFGIGTNIPTEQSPQAKKIITAALNKLKVMKNKRAFFDFKEGDKWYKQLQKNLGGLSREPLNRAIKTIAQEEFPNSYIGKAGKKRYRQEMVVKTFIDSLEVNNGFTGNEKFSDVLKEFRGKDQHVFEIINRDFKSWVKGEYEVDGVDRSKLTPEQLKEIKNYKRGNQKQIRSVNKEQQLKWMHGANDRFKNLSAEEVEKKFFRKFPNAPKNAFLQRANELVQIKRTGSVISGADSTIEYKWAKTEPDNRSKWLKQTYGKQFGGNYGALIKRADEFRQTGNIADAIRLENAADKYFGPKGIFRKATGEGEHPFSRIMGGADQELKINSLVRGDLNQFKRANFDVPVIQLLNKYSLTEPGSVARQKIINEIEDRKKLMNLLTETKSEKGIVDVVKFNYGQTKIGPSTQVVPIDKLDEMGKFNVQDFVVRGENYLKGFQTAALKAPVLMTGEKITTKKFKGQELQNLLAALGCPGKAMGGRIGFQEGTIPSTQCVRAGANIINEGNLKNLSQGQRINAERFLNGAYKLGRGVAKFGVVPEAIFVAGESLFRIGMGDTLDEAFKRATDYLRTGDQTLEADASKISRTLFDQDAANLFKDVSNFRKTKKNLEGAQVNLDVDLAQNNPEFSGMSDEDIRKIGEDRIKKAKDDFFNAQISKEQQVLSDYQFDQARDISKAQSFFTAQKLKGKQMGAIEDDPLQIDLTLAPEQKQSPFIDVRSVLTQTPESIANEINKAYQAGEYGQTGLEESFEKAKEDYSKTLNTFFNIKNAPLSELAASPVVGVEQIYGANPENFLQKILPPGASFDQRLAYDFAGGGIAKLAGVDSGPPPEKGPTPQGLDFLLKRGR